MNYVFLMDPLSSVIIEKDTTFVLMLSAFKKGHKVFFLPSGGMVLKNGRMNFHITEVVPQQVKGAPFIEKNQCCLSDDEVDVVFIRTDPPFNYEYLVNTWLLERSPSKVKIINKPSGVRAANEKIWATQFVSVIPPTLVGRQKSELLDFLSAENEIVAKPTDGFGGQQIFKIKNGDSNASVIFETLSQNYSRDIILQKYINESTMGDKRILLLNGEPLGAVLRVHCQSDHRNNIFSGGKVERSGIIDNDLRIIDAISSEIKRLGLYFVGIDIIGNYLIEINVTSPTCIQEIDRFNNDKLEDKVIEFSEKLTKEN
ncbi:MAG: glutathione synthase [Omnitrophica WOR_2 bacterium GWA2_37_7]|nr:MAG: glutathione synthase [Omnitrophica WOR_2 bacterium GWA2_37_7]